MIVGAVTAWQTVVSFCDSIFDTLVGFFNTSFFNELTKTQDVLGVKFTYVGLIFSGTLLFIIGRKIFKLIVGV